MKAECRNKNCGNKKYIENMFYLKVPYKTENGEVFYGCYSGIYFCDTSCFLVYKGVIEDVKVIKELKCKQKPTCDDCFSKLSLSPLPILYNHKPSCEQIFVSLEQKEIEQEELIKRCYNCKEFGEATSCKIEIKNE